jgi:hypothetical protein
VGQLPRITVYFNGSMGAVVGARMGILTLILQGASDGAPWQKVPQSLAAADHKTEEEVMVPDGLTTITDVRFGVAILRRVGGHVKLNA